MKIYTDEEMELISNILDLISARYNSKEFSDLVREIKNLIKENQTYAREIERLNNIINELKQKLNLAENILYDYLYKDKKITKELYDEFKELKGDGSNE